MPTQSNNYRCSVVRYDGILRFQVPSRRPGQPPYLVQLDSYGGNGRCVCKDFTKRKEPLLIRGITPQAALDGGLLEVPPWGTVEDILRCFHCHVARLKFADDVIAAISEEQKHARTNEHDPAQETTPPRRTD